MKKTAIIAGSFLLLFGAAVNAQTPTTDSVPAAKEAVTTPVTTQPVATTTSASSNDTWNNHNPDKYKLLPMPAPLTREKIFPVIGKYELTAKTTSTTSSTTAAATMDPDPSATATEAAATTAVTIDLDESNKGIVWVDGLPQGRIKAMLRKAPGTYKIPAQKTADNKDLAEGVLIFDKDNNTLDVCIGCTYNIEDPASAFAPPAEPVVDATVKTKTTKSKTKVKAKKVTPVKTWKYSGSKVVEATEAPATVVPVQ